MWTKITTQSHIHEDINSRLNSSSSCYHSAQSICGPISCLVKVRLSLCLIEEAPRHEVIWGSGGRAPPFLNSALDGSEWSASRSCRFPPGERTLCRYWIKGWVGLKAGLNSVGQKSLTPSGTRTPAVQSVTRRYTDWAIDSHLRSKNVNTEIYRIKFYLHLCMSVETSSLALGEEHGLRMFEIRVLRWIIGSVRKTVTRKQRRLHKEKLHNV
jgi:hypothetical protein